MGGAGGILGTFASAVKSAVLAAALVGSAAVAGVAPAAATAPSEPTPPYVFVPPLVGLPYVGSELTFGHHSVPKVQDRGST